MNRRWASCPARPKSARIDAGAVVLGPGTSPPRCAFVIRSGAVELVTAGRVFDLLGEGEMFGYAAMLAQLPVGFTARTAERTTLLEIPEPALRPVLERPAALRFVARTLAETPSLFVAAERPTAADPAGRAVRELIRGPALVCEPSATVREAARPDGRGPRELRARRAAPGGWGSSPTATCARASWPPARTPTRRCRRS